MPAIVGVVDQGGDGYGAAQAFISAHQARCRPSSWAIARTNWPGGRSRNDKSGYRTWSASIAPGISTLAFWVAQQVLDGNKKVPHDLIVPYLAFTQDDFEAALKTIPKGGVASREYTPG